MDQGLLLLGWSFLLLQFPGHPTLVLRNGGRVGHLVLPEGLLARCPIPGNHATPRRAISSAIKILVDRPRPQFDDPITEAFGKSFPSGHAMSSTIGYGTLLFAFMPLIPDR